MQTEKKSMEDASLNGLIVNLAEKIREGDADGICEEFDKLKLALYQKHNAYLRANSDRLDPKESINNIIAGGKNVAGIKADSQIAA